jgi:tetratricopeptide (TPR) repeat protein
MCINRWLERDEQHMCPVCRRDALPVHASFALRGVVRALHPERGRFELRPPTAAQEKDRGNTAYRQGDYAQAITHYGRAIELGDDTAAGTATVHANRAMCYILTRQHRLALTDCDAALAIAPGYVKALVRKALCHEALQQPSEACKAVELAMTADTKNEYRAQIIEIWVRVAPAPTSAPAPAPAPLAPHDSIPLAPPQDQRGRQRQQRGLSSV